MLRTTAVWTTPQGGPYYSTLFFAGTGSASASESALAHQALWSTLAGKIANSSSVQVEPEVVELDVETGTPTAVYTEITSPVIGGSSSQPMPFATQGLLRFVTETFVNGRRVRGRLFLPAMVEDSSPGGKPSDLFVSDVNSAAAAWLATIDTDSPLVIWSRPIEGPDGRPGSQHEVASATAWTQWAVLRSRRD